MKKGLTTRAQTMLVMLTRWVAGGTVVSILIDDGQRSKLGHATANQMAIRCHCKHASTIVNTKD